MRVTSTRRSLRPVLVGLTASALCLAQSSAPETQSVNTKPAGQAGITTDGQRGGQQRRSPEGTREFLGLAAPPDPAAAARGGKLYASACVFCHGAKASGGDSGPDLLRSALVLHDAKGELIGPVIHNGRVNRGMPSFAAITEEELSDIAAFLHERVELAANRGTYQLLDVVTGDPKKGEAWFRGGGGCTQCHSITGDLAGIGSKLSGPDLQQTLLYPAAGPLASPKAMVQKATVALPSGQRIEGVVMRLDDFNVMLRDETGAVRAFALTDGVKLAIDDPLAAHRALLDVYTDAEMHDITAYLATLK